MVLTSLNTLPRAEPVSAGGKTYGLGIGGMSRVGTETLLTRANGIHLSPVADCNLLFALLPYSLNNSATTPGVWHT